MDRQRGEASAELRDLRQRDIGGAVVAVNQNQRPQIDAVGLESPKFVTARRKRTNQHELSDGPT